MSGSGAFFSFLSPFSHLSGPFTLIDVIVSVDFIAIIAIILVSIVVPIVIAVAVVVVAVVTVAVVVILQDSSNQ